MYLPSTSTPEVQKILEAEIWEKNNAMPNFT